MYSKIFFLEDEESAIDAYISVVNGMDSGNQAAVALLQRNQVIAEVRPDAEKAGDLALLVKVVKLLGKGHVGEAIAVVRQEFFFSFQILLDRFQALADIGIDSRIREGDAPIMDIAVAVDRASCRRPIGRNRWRRIRCS